MSEKTVQVKTFTDREVLLCESASYAAEGRLSIEDVAPYPYPDVEQFAYVKKEDLLDALARFGWLPEEYLKPEPLDPREAKIQEIVLNLVNADRATHAVAGVAEYESYESYEELVSSVTGPPVTPYRNNAEALIDAGLVTVDE